MSVTLDALAGVFGRTMIVKGSGESPAVVSNINKSFL